MLETVKQTIKKSPCISFGRYFTEYVFRMQDESIDNEVTFLLRNNKIDVNFFNKVMNKQVEDSGAL